MLLDSIKLRKKRDEKKFSQAELARLIDLSPQRIWEWEQKDCNVKIEHVLKISEALEVDINELSKESSTVKILNNHHQNKDTSQAVVGFDINVQAPQVPIELLNAFKSQIDNQNNFISNQQKLLEDYCKHTSFLEEVINWLRSKSE